MSDNKRPPTPDDNFISDEQSVPLYREELSVGKETIHTGEVRVRRETIHRQAPVTGTLAHFNVSVETIPAGRYVDKMSPPVNDGNVLIIPVYEEHIEVKKRIYLKEEVRVIQNKSDHVFKEQVEIKEQVITVTRNKK